jgi:cytidylate kinase
VKLIILVIIISKNVMKEDYFIKYMLQVRDSKKTQEDERGPVITISREFGCYGSEIAQLLAKKLTAISPENKKWHCITQEVLEETSKALEVEPDKISHVFGAKEKSSLEQLIAYFSHNKYTSDLAIKRTISKTVKKYAEQGNTIIVGRAACMLSQHIKKSAHIRLVAPYLIRVQRIRERFKIPLSEAKKVVEENDKKRFKFMSFFRGNKPDSEIFDLIINRSVLNSEQITDLIILLAKQKGLI